MRTNSHHRLVTGQSLVELSAVLVVCLPILLCCVDAVFIALGASINDGICRDATRAAGSGKPQSAIPGLHAVAADASPYLRAVAVIREHNPTDLPIKVGDNPEVQEAVKDIPPDNMGGAVDGRVQVTTTVQVIPPFLLSGVVPEGVTLKSTHSMPYTYTVRQTPAKPI